MSGHTDRCMYNSTMSFVSETCLGLVCLREKTNRKAVGGAYGGYFHAAPRARQEQLAQIFDALLNSPYKKPRLIHRIYTERCRLMPEKYGTEHTDTATKSTKLRASDTQTRGQGVFMYLPNTLWIHSHITKAHPAVHTPPHALYHTLN